MMLKKKLVLVLLPAVLVIALFSFCACDLFYPAVDDEELVVEQPQYESYAEGFTRTSKVVDKESVADDMRDFELEKSEDYDISYETVKATSSYTDLCSYGANDAILWPGAIVDINNNSYSPIALQRAPITISPNLETLTGKKLQPQTIEKPTLSSVRTGINSIVNDNISSSTSVPSNLTMEIHEVTHENEFALNLGFGLQVKKFVLSENFSYSKMNRQTNLVVVLKQIYYTIDVDFPEIGAKDFLTKT